MFCQTCGKNISNAAAFCPFCGAAIPPQNADPNGLNNGNQPNYNAQQTPNQNYGNQPNYNAQPSPNQNYGNQPNYNAQQAPNQNFGNQPNYNAQQTPNQNYGNQPNYNAQQTPNQNYGNQPNFNAQQNPNQNYGNQPNYNAQQAPNQNFGNQPNYNAQQNPNQNYGNQPNYNAQQTPNQNYGSQPNFYAQKAPNQNFGNQPNYGAQQMPNQNYGENGLTWDIIKRNNCIIGTDGKRYGIGWLKFILYFQLFASAFSGVMNGILFMTGSLYGPQKKLVYDRIEGLQTLDATIGILFILFAALAIVSRFMLVKLKKYGPISYYVVCGGTLLLNLIYVIAVSAMLPTAAASIFGSVFPGMMTSTALLIANIIYFRNRSNVFIY